MMISHQTPSTSLFLTSLITSTLMLLSTTSWIMVWLTMEMNLMFMIPLMMLSKMSYETESTIKYFLIQAPSSTLMLTSVIMYLQTPLNNISATMFTMSLMIKLGIAPFHLWLPTVLNGLTWNMIILITTWQKLGPLIIMSYMLHLWNPTTLLTIVLLNALGGGLGGINQTTMRPLIAFSSIAHMAWMMTSSSLSHILMMVYFITYSTIIISLILIIKSMVKLTTNKFHMSTQLSSNMSSSLTLTLLSLSGMPPFLGFIPKWMVILMLLESNIIMPFILFLSSLLSLFYYLTLLFSSTLTNMKPLMLNTSPPLLYITSFNILPTLIMLNYL